MFRLVVAAALLSISSISLAQQPLVYQTTIVIKEQPKDYYKEFKAEQDRKMEQYWQFQSIKNAEMYQRQQIQLQKQQLQQQNKGLPQSGGFGG